MSENEIELEFKATIEDGWYLYSQYLPVDADAFPTKITFLASQDYELVGETIEPEPIKNLIQIMIWNCHTLKKRLFLNRE